MKKLKYINIPFMYQELAKKYLQRINQVFFCLNFFGGGLHRSISGGVIHVSSIFSSIDVRWKQNYTINPIVIILQ